MCVLIVCVILVVVFVVAVLFLGFLSCVVVCARAFVSFGFLVRFTLTENENH